MLRAIYKSWRPGGERRKKRVLNKIRRQLASCGYGVGDLTDIELEAAVAYGGKRVVDVMPLTAKKAYWILRRLPPDVTGFRRQKLN
jgi:hypothetical protein